MRKAIGFIAVLVGAWAVPTTVHSQAPLISISELKFAQSPRLVPVETIPTADAPVFFGSVADVAGSADGFVMVADPMNHAVYRFSSVGAFRDSIGRRGRGPGEFETPSLTVGFADGGFAVADIAQQRVGIWDSTSRLVAMHPVPDQLSGMWWTRGGLVVRFAEFRFPQVHIVYGVLDTRSGQLDRRITVTVTQDQQTGAGTGTTCQYCANTVTPDGLIVVTPPTGEYVLMGLRRGGGVTEFARRSVPRVQRSDEEIEAMRALIQRGGGRPLGPEFFRDLPAVASLASDGQGRIWAQRSAPAGSETIVDVFARDGSLIGSIPLGLGVKRVRIQDMMLFAMAEDADGIPVVRIYRIVG